MTTTANPEEIARFAAIADGWWDTSGEMKPLHDLNPLRLRYIRDRVSAEMKLQNPPTEPLRGVRILDVGCGGGLIAEPLARMGATVTAIDAGEETIRIAQIHAHQAGLAVDYRCATPEHLMPATDPFDVVTVMEVVEHVDHREAFLKSCARLVKPEGLLFAATLNRTLKSLALAKIGAEYLLRWLPVGTHSWRKFVKPAELAAPLRAEGLTVKQMTGVIYHPIRGVWSLQERNLEVNYMGWFKRESGGRIPEGGNKSRPLRSPASGRAT